ncbi:AMP-binding protein [Catenulispora sp. NF23]|uniref:AMP-binding protein n=1 Tax=Catenulispora pinistramenti TaxID=2705254 RepID=UPI001BA812A5|nr:AMP-binding protein [Catenulispora pinistramenti]MBS2531669.1 AMP-binding protein [Catenulispora pinistramenti]
MTMSEQIHGFELSPQQEAAWHSGNDSVSDKNARRTFTVAYIDQQALAARLEALVADYEILRTRFVKVPGLRIPVQVVDPPSSVSVEHDTRERRVLLRAGQLMVELAHQDDGADRLVLTMPHLSADRTTWAMLADLLLSDVPYMANADRLQYADIAAWLRGQIGETDTSSFDASAMPTADARAGLPFSASAALSRPDACPQIVTVTLDRSLLEGLHTVTRKLAVSEPGLLLAAWSSLTARYAQADESTITVITQGRATDGMRDVLGMLERCVAVNVLHDMATPFAEVAQAATRTLVVADEQENRHDPASPLRSGSPELSFAYRQGRWASVSGLEDASGLEVPGILHLECARTPDALELAFIGTQARIAEIDLRHIADAFHELLTDAVADVELAVGALRLARTVPRERAEGAHCSAVLDRFLEHVRLTPDSTAVQSVDRALTYRELGERAGAVAATLAGHGVGPGDHVPVVAPASVDTIAAMLGTWLVGASFVPLDPAWPCGRIESITDQLAPVVALVPQEAFGISLPVPAVPVPHTPVSAPPAPANAEGVAYVIFTSGTSGLPKGVVIGHDQLAHYAAAATKLFGLTTNTNAAAVSTLAADLAYTAIFPTLACGGCVHLLPADVSTDPSALAEYLRANPVDLMKLVPSHLNALIGETSDPLTLLPHEVLVLGGEMFPWSLRDKLAEVAPGLRVFNHYGPSETTIGVSCLPVRSVTDERCRSVPVGAGLGESILSIVDEQGRTLPPWCPGEVLVTGPSVGMGYLAELRAGGAGFGQQYRTGDLGRFVPGAGVEILGRLDDQVKVRGYRIQLGEIEELLRGREDVADCAVIARKGDNGLVAHLDAYVAGEGLSVSDLREALGRDLPAALVPNRWQLLDRLPITANGKLDRKALNPIDRPRSEAGRPRDAVEQRLAVLWSEVLDTDEIAPDDDFFSLGGHSLAAIKLISRANAAFGCKMPMSAIFTARTVTSMAELVRGEAKQGSNLVPLRPGASGSMFCIHPGGGMTLSYWELAQMLPAVEEIIGIESLGLHGKPPEKKFIDMATGYADAIAAHTQAAPVLIGWCFGGLMALEIAQCLRRAGRDVAGLVVINCPAPGYRDDSEDAGHKKILLTESPTEATLISRFAWHYNLTLPGDLPPGDAKYGDLLKVMQTDGYLPPTAGREDLAVLFDVYASNMLAYEQDFITGHREYPTPDFPVTLIRAEPAHQPRDTDRTWGWQSLVGPDLSFDSVDADHHGIMRSPAVRELAAVIARELELESGGR